MSVTIELPEAFNVATYFLEANLTTERRDRLAIIEGDRQATYGDLAALANRAGNALRSLGVEAENRVLLLLHDTIEFPAAFWGAIRIGAVPIPTNTLMRPPDYAYFLNDSRAKVLVVDASLWPAVAEIRDQLRFLQHVVVVGEAPPGTLAWQDLIDAASDTLETFPTHRDDAAFWLYSSGSTGFPKGAVHLQHDMVYAAECYGKQTLGIRPDDRVLSAAKLFFAYGLGNSLYFPFSVGATAVYFKARPTPETMFETIRAQRPTLFFGVPTLYAAMLAVPDEKLAGYDLSSLRLCISAGETLPAEIYRRWKDRFGVEILDGIGTTEALHIFISNRPGESRAGTSGQIVPGYEARIVDEDDRPVPQGELGNLLIRGESTCAYYWNKHDLTKRTVRGEWLATGDKYYQDEAGFFYYAGRADDMLKVGGIWVSPAEVENCLLGHEAVLEAAVVGRADAEDLIKPQAFVTVRPGYEPSVDLGRQLQEFVKGRLAPYKYPRWIEFVEELPKTATGKIQRYKLRE